MNRLYRSQNEEVKDGFFLVIRFAGKRYF